MDPGPGRGDDRTPVRRRLPAARGVVSAAPHGLQPAGSRPARGRTRPGGDRDVAAEAVAGGNRLAAARGAWICLPGRGRSDPATAEKPDLAPARADPGG